MEGFGYSYVGENIARGVSVTDSGKEKNTSFFGFWVNVDDYESATEAAKNASIAAFYITISYIIVLGYNYFTGESLFGAEFNDELERYIAYGTYSFIAIFFLWLGLRVRKEKFGSVPFIALWTLFEIGTKLVSVPGKGIILNIIFTIVSVNALWGWYRRKKFLALTASN